MALNGLCALMCLYNIIFLLHNIIYIHYFTDVFPMVIEHFAVLFMFIVNVSNNSFSVLLKIFLKIFCVCWVKLPFVHSFNTRNRLASEIL